MPEEIINIILSELNRDDLFYLVHNTKKEKFINIAIPLLINKK